MEELSDIDSIVQSTEASTNQEIPMEAPAPVEPQAQPEPTPQEYEFQYNGQKIKAPIEKILRWAEQGYGAPNKIGELSKKLSDYETKSKQYEAYEKSYKPVDEWAKANPDRWNNFLTAWQQAQYGVPPQTPEQAQAQAQLPPELIQKLQSHDQFIQSLQEKETVQRQQAADRGLEGEIQSIRKQFSNLDFDAPNEQGQSLELQILEHASKNGIPSFRAAFRDYCFDKLSQMSESKGRENTQISPKTKAALLGKDPAAGKVARSPSDLIKGRNYDQIHQLILEHELGIGG